MNKKVFTQTFYHKNKFNFVMAMAATLLVSSLTVALAVLLQQITDAAMGGTVSDILDLLWKSVLYLLVLLVGQLVLRYFKNRFLTRAVVQYREKVFASIMDKNITAFSEENTSDYISGLTNDVKTIEDNYVESVFNLITYAVYFVGAFLCMLLYNIPMTIFVLFVSFVPILVSVLFGNKLQKAEETLSNKNADYVNTIQDMLQGFTVLKSFRAETHFLKNYNISNQEAADAKYNRNMTGEMIGILSGVIGGAVQIGVFLFGAYLAVKGKMTAGAVIAFVQLMNYVLSPIEKIPQLLSTRKAAEKLIEKMAGLLDKNAVEDGTKEIESIKEKLVLEDISFKYEEENILHDINLQFEQGKSYAVVGASGSGKSTLLNLLSGRMDDYTGTIMADDMDLKTIQKKCIFDVFSMIEQKVYIFDDTISNNITLYQSMKEDKVKEAIKKANLSNLISERGADYKCGENGSKLSGGEKQRISIARSMLKKASVFLLDEATSALDTENAGKITEEILSLKDVIKIVVTHKLSANLLNQFDEIIVLQNGTVKEKGNFKELMEKKEYFYAMFTLENSAESEIA